MGLTRFGDTGEVDLDHAGDPGAYEMWSTGGGRASVLEVGNFFQSELGRIHGGASTLESGPIYRYSRMYIRFRDVFGTDANQVPPEADIQGAILRLYNTHDLGAKVSAGGAFLGETVFSPEGIEMDNPYAAPKLNAGTIGIYPSLIPIAYGFDDGTATKGKVTGKERRRDKQVWSQGVPDGPYCQDRLSNGGLPNDAFAIAFNCGPGDSDDTAITLGSHEIDSSHPGAIEIFQDANEEFKEFDVSGLMDFITSDGVFITALSPAGEIPTMDINYGNAYRSSEFGNTYDNDGNLLTAASSGDIATRPMLIIELDGPTIPGDANADGTVDIADLGIVGANFGQTNVKVSHGDFNGDGNVDVADLGIVAPTGPQRKQVARRSYLAPEPATSAILTLVVICMGFRPRRACVTIQH